MLVIDPIAKACWLTLCRVYFSSGADLSPGGAFCSAEGPEWPAFQTCEVGVSVNGVKMLGARRVDICGACSIKNCGKTAGRPEAAWSKAPASNIAIVLWDRAIVGAAPGLNAYCRCGRRFSAAALMSCGQVPTNRPELGLLPSHRRGFPVADGVCDKTRKFRRRRKPSSGT